MKHITKDDFERMCRNAGMRPELRTPLKDLQCYIADGFSLMPHNAWRRFGIDEDEFPGGMYVTMWMLSRDEKLSIARPLFYDASHDPWLDAARKRKARISAALKDAEQHLKDRKTITGKYH